MNTTGYLVLAIVVIALLLFIFVLTFICYIRTPAPQGCEDMKISEDHCASCTHKECSFYPGEK